VKVGLVFETLKTGIDGMADNSAWPDRAVKPRSRAAARRRRGA